jgi:predicted acetyltransferase
MSHTRLVEADYEDKSLIRNLMQFYLYEITAFDGAGPNRHGLFEYRYLDHYWTEDGRAAGRVPFLIQVGDDVAGFALKHRWSVISRSPDASTVAEFFVLPSWRRQGVGRAAATTLFDRFPGPWEVRELRTNLSAQRFWCTVIGAYTNGNYQELDLGPNEWDGPTQVFIAGAHLSRGAGS